MDVCHQRQHSLRFEVLRGYQPLAQVNLYEKVFFCTETELITMERYSKIASYAKLMPERVSLSSNGRYLYTTLTIFTFLAVFSIYFILSQPLRLGTPEIQVSKSRKPQTITCGASRIEAIANNCRLDVMGDAWLPPQCFNETAALAAFDNTTALSYLTGARIFDWYLDANHTRPISWRDIQALDSLRAYTVGLYRVPPRMLLSPRRRKHNLTSNHAFSY